MTGAMSMLLCIVSLLLVSPHVVADIPVHCVQPQIIGLWRFHIGTYGAGDPNCGFAAPDPPDGHHALTPPVRDPAKKEKGKYYLGDAFKESFHIDVAMKDWTSEVVKVEGAEGSRQFPGVLPKGSWTMVYDEGFHVSLTADAGDVHNFFAFSKYVLDSDEQAKSINTFETKKVSVCNTTLLGWYKQVDRRTYGVKSNMCYWGERIGSLADAGLTTPPVVPLPRKKAAKQLRPMRPESEPQLPPSVPGQGPGVPPTEPVAPQAETVASANTISKASIWRTGLQMLLCASVLISMLSLWKGVQADGKSRPYTYGWRIVAVASLCIIALVLRQLASPSKQIPQANMTTHGDAKSVGKGGPPPASSPPVKRKRTVKEMMDQTNAQRQAAKEGNLTVRWESDPEKLRAFMRHRSDEHGVQISEESEVQTFLNAFSPPPSVALPGFGNAESIGIARAVAVEEQMRIAASLGKEPNQLTTEDLKHWQGSSDNHHKDRAFSMNGRELKPDGWKTLPAFDWRNVTLTMGGKTYSNFVNAVPDQGGCGSCYGTAAVSMLSSRLMLRYPELIEKFRGRTPEDRISVQQHLDCNPYEQGCDGGYPYLIALWGMENDLQLDSCYSSSRTSSGGDAKLKLARRHGGGSHCVKEFSGPECDGFRFRVQNFRYLGGALGRCGMHHLCEAGLREELYKGGPLVVTIEPTAPFWGYTGGILHEIPATVGNLASAPGHGNYNEMSEYLIDKQDCNSTECFIWRKVDHSVLLVGWDEDTSQGRSCQPLVRRIEPVLNKHSPDPKCEEAKTEAACAHKKQDCVWQGFQYWVIQNSWGKGWGEGGFMRLGPRGGDPIRVESMSVAADPEWIRDPPQSSSKAVDKDSQLGQAK